MACRVKIKLKRGDKIIETIALLNSGFESDEPDIIVPTSIAEELDLWPPRPSSTIVLETGGGETANPYYPDSAELELVLEDREPKKLRVNIIVNPYVDEVALSDYVISQLGIVLLDFKEGIWRLKDDPPDKMRRSEQRRSR
ncbi:MAG: hypothetical protein DRM97_02675 [Thermoprotei archaeon]|nr:MAG: hypothetical protein DRM97_02675 [Thermoprotei archaeon]